MAKLRKLGADDGVLLPDDAVIGRSRDCDVVLGHPAASGLHARFHRRDDLWCVHDLNSRNGTWVDGERLTSEPRSLERGSRLVFGSPEETWVLEDTAPSGLFARSDRGCIRASDGTLELPSADASSAAVVRALDERWCLERDRSQEPLAHREVRVIGERSYRFFLPEGDDATTELVVPPLLRRHLELYDNGDRIHATLVDGGRHLDLGSRAHHVVLLVLARAWLHDQRLGHVPRAERGWLHREDIVSQAALADVSHLNVLIFRLRRQLDCLEVREAAGIIERRPGEGELRLGLPRVVVHEPYARPRPPRAYPTVMQTNA